MVTPVPANNIILLFVGVSKTLEEVYLSNKTTITSFSGINWSPLISGRETAHSSCSFWTQKRWLLERRIDFVPRGK